MKRFWIGAGAVIAIGLLLAVTDIIANSFWFFAAYVVLQYVVLATAWNIMGGYMGYVNFGSAGFFAIGAYTAIVLYNLVKAPLLVMIPLSGIVCGLMGLGMGYLTLRLRGVYFAIGTLALAVVLETLMVNWDYVGGATGAYVIRPRTLEPFGDYVKFLTFVMLVLAVIAVAAARWIERAKFGRGLHAIRDDEIAAECAGIPTLRLKLIATHPVRLPDGHRRGAVPALCRLRRARVGLQPRLCGQRHRHADDRRDDDVGGAGDRRAAARHGATDRQRHHLV